MRLSNHKETEIKRHIKVKGEKSPLDGDWIYWTSRIGKTPKFRQEWQHYSRNKKENVITVDLTLKMECESF